MQSNGRIRVAIVGGGCAAVAAAYELTKPELAGRYEVTVYQQGWRLGGKGASGRGPHGRIEEHGLHIWMGFYENAFRLMRGVYDELGRDPALCSMADWRDAFTPASHVGLTDWSRDRDWTVWSAMFPPLPGEPGDPLDRGATNPFSIVGYLARAAQVTWKLFRVGYGPETDEPVFSSHSTSTLSELLRGAVELSRVAFGIGASVVALVAKRLEMLVALLGVWSRENGEHGGERSRPLTHAVLRLLERIQSSLRDLPTFGSDEVHRARTAEVLEVLVAAQLGALRAGVITSPEGFDVLDDLDFADWLRQNGASNDAVCSSFVRGLYSLMFAYEDGDFRRPRAAAGQALRGCLRMFFTYRGAFFWKMCSGMGDAIFAPLYELLRRRGVRFEFFHRLTNVELSTSSGPPHARALDFMVQARPLGGTYEPLVEVRTVPSWPAEPLWEKLESGEEHRLEGRRFESFSDNRQVGKLRLAVGSDFDFVVLGVSVGAIPQVCSEIVRRDPRWQAMVKGMKTVATQALQIWTSVPLESLSWQHGPITLTGFTSPFDTWADMSHLLEEEDWPDDKRPASINYFCNVLPDAAIDAADPTRAGFHERVTDHVLSNARTFVERDLPVLWPGLAGDTGTRWDALYDWRPSPPSDKGRLESQFWTANVNPTDRYVLCLPGTPSLRISPLDRTYDNLTIAGDWTSCGLNLGCVEAAVMSGMLAAHALTGTSPPLASIIGYDHP